MGVKIVRLTIKSEGLASLGLHQIFYVQIVFGYYFANNEGGATI